jgi:hypothetical protein
MLKSPTDRRYTLENEFVYKTQILGKSFISTFLIVKPDGEITVRPGFVWDGATLVPDGKKGPDGLPRGYYPSLVHDVLYKYYPKHEITREAIDRLFYDMLIEYGFSRFWAYVYYLGVQKLGDHFLRIVGRK